MNILLDVLNFTSQSEFNYDLPLRLAALFHDVGKPLCKSLKPDGNSSYKEHEIISSNLAETILKRLKFDNSTIKEVSWLIKKHMIFKEYESYSVMSKDKIIRKLIAEMLSDRYFNIEKIICINSCR